jgi:hypothetical protein
MLSIFSKVYNKVFVTNVVIATLLLSCSLNTPNSTTPKKVDLKSNSLTSKPFKINGLSTLKVPFVPNNFGFSNYYGNYIYLKSDPVYISQTGGYCWYGDCTGAWVQYYQAFDGYYSNQLIRFVPYEFSYGNLEMYSGAFIDIRKNLGSEYPELNKKYDVLPEFHFANFFAQTIYPKQEPFFDEVTGTTRTPEAYFQVSRIDDNSVSVKVIAKNLHSPKYQDYAGYPRDYFAEYKLDNFEQSIVLGVTSDELTLNVDNLSINGATDIKSSNISVSTTSSTRVWTLDIKKDETIVKSYSGTTANNFIFPENGLDSLTDGNYTVNFYYRDQPSQVLSQVISVKKGGDEICNTQEDGSTSCFSCLPGQNIIFKDGLPIGCQVVNTSDPEQYYQDENNYFPFGVKGFNRVSANDKCEPKVQN